MKVLIGCEFSGVVRDAFIAEGHDAISCDLLPTERPGPHIQGDVREVLQEPWDLVIAHPPCERLTQLNDCFPSNQKRPAFEQEFEAAVRLFLECLNANAPLVAVENPRMHKRAKAIIGPYAMKVQPYEFGADYSKDTCFWVRGLPPLMPTNFNDKHQPFMSFTSMHGEKRHGKVSDTGWGQHGIDRKHNRNRFHPGMAAAMARQWGNYE